jgi:hypothetical protein
MRTLEEIFQTSKDALVSIDQVDLKDKTYLVTSTRKMTRIIEGKKFPWVDVFLKLDLSDGEEQFRLHYVQEADRLSVLFMSLYDALSWAQEFEEIQAEEWFRFDDDGRTFRRVGEARGNYHATGEISGDHPGLVTLDYWDWWREVGEKREYCYVERDGETGRFEVWVGSEIYEPSIMII